MKSIKSNIVLNCVRTAISVLFPFVVFQYASRILFAENLGKVNFSNSVVNYFILIAGLGISSYSIRESGILINEKNRMEEFASEVFSINLLSTIISYILLMVVLFSFDKLHPYILLTLILSISVLSTTFGMDWINIVYEDYKYITIRTLVFQALSLILTIIFVRKKSDYYIFAWIVSLGKVGPDLLNWFYIRKRYVKIKFIIRQSLVRHLKPILFIFFNALVITIYVNFDTTMIGLIRGDTDVGYYSVSVKIYTALKTVFSAIISVTISRLSLYFSSNEIQKAQNIIAKMLNYFIVSILPLIAFIILNSSNIITVLFGLEYEISVIPLQILSIGVLLSVFASVVTNCIFLPLKMEKYSLIATSISAAENFVLNIFFIPKWGIEGAAISTVIAEGTVFFISYIYLRKKKLPFISLLRIKNIIVASLIVVLMCLVNRISNSLLDAEWKRLILESTSFILIYLIVFYKKIFNYIKRRNKEK